MTARDDRPTKGGYPSSDRPASDLPPPPRGPAPGARRAPVDWGAAPEDVDPNEDGIGYE